MIFKASFLFCANEHGIGDVTYPDVDTMGGFELKQYVMKGPRVSELRKLAKAEGWGRVNGDDYCPTCMESGI
jgi:hypothetical protein